MATKLGKIIADFITQLAAQMEIGATTATLQNATDDDGVALPAGQYYFTLDNGTDNKEYIQAQLSGTALTAIKTVSRQGVLVAGTVRLHRVGANVVLTDFLHIMAINNLLSGTDDLNSATPLGYDGAPAITDPKHIATKKYVDDTTAAGASDASTSVKGISKMSVAPASAPAPIAVGDNDPRVPTLNEKGALAGTGTPSSSNKYVTEDDANLTNNVKTSTDQTVAGIKTFSAIPVLPASDPSSANQAVRKSYADGLAVYSGQLSIAAGGGHTLYYRKVGKVYFDFHLDSTSDNMLGTSDSSVATTVVQIASVLGITVADYIALNFYTGSITKWNYNGAWGTASTFRPGDQLVAIQST